MQFLVLFSLFFAVTFASAMPYSIQGRIANGISAANGQFPFQVGLLIFRNDHTISLCGGSIISDRFILTAAHCFINVIFLNVLIGDLEILKGNPLVISVDKKHITTHEDFSNYINDIALIELPEKLALSENLKPINLPRKSQRDVTFVNTEGWITGWGASGNGNSHSEDLQYARRMILSDTTCSKTFGSSYAEDTQMCVDGSDAISICRGDSGGPLSILEADGSWTIVGIASYGALFCEKGHPTVFTRVTKYIDWISKKTGVVLRD